MIVSEYEQQAEKFLQDSGLEFRAVLVGSDCPQFCEEAAAEKDMDKVDVFPRKTHIHGKHYRCTISSKGRGHVSFDFWNSYANEEQNFFWYEADSSLNSWITSRENVYWDKYRKGGRKPRLTVTAYGLLACLTKCDPGSFDNFCADYGYDEDSRKAESVYRAVQKEWEKVSRFFSTDELAMIQGIS